MIFLIVVLVLGFAAFGYTALRVRALGEVLGGHLELHRATVTPLVSDPDLLEKVLRPSRDALFPKGFTPPEVRSAWVEPVVTSLEIRNTGDWAADAEHALRQLGADDSVRPMLDRYVAGDELYPVEQAIIDRAHEVLHRGDPA